jgi:hypothetical protein
MENKSKDDNPEKIKIDKALRPETEEQRSAESRIGEADIAQCRARMAALSTPGRILTQEGEELVVPATMARAMFEAESN